MVVSNSPSVLRPQQPHPVPLSSVFATAELSWPAVSGITLDSRLAQVGDLYVALPGQHVHGAAFAGAAVERGVVAILTDAAGAEQLRTCSRSYAATSVPVVAVKDPRAVMAEAASTIYRRPAESMPMLAVTGTNGKTTTAFLLAAALQADGCRPGVIGTMGFLLDGHQLVGNRTTVTTPEAPELHGLLALMLERGTDCVAMEVSSHAMALHRVDAIRFTVAGFTNLGRDHLDFHHTQEQYFEAKALLFTPEHTRQAVINIDDEWGRKLSDRIAAAGQVGLITTSLGQRADFCLSEVRTESSGASAVIVRTPTGELSFTVGMPGDFNVRNALTACAMLANSGMDLDLSRAVTGFSAAQVPGRMQRVDLGQRAPAVFVDFAHTPQAVAAALQALSASRRIAVLGCGGDRDPEKRGPMGAAAAAGADVVVVTDDNPRSEDPALIRAQTMAGAREQQRLLGSDVVIIDGGDRRSAIRRALVEAGPDDQVAILGKGHEQGQEIAGQLKPFDDVSVVAEEWSALSPAPTSMLASSPAQPASRPGRSVEPA